MSSDTNHLPAIETVHADAIREGFGAWKVFVEQRLALLPDVARAQELAAIRLLCLEEFCSLGWHSPTRGGEFFVLDELRRLRERNNGEVLQSDIVRRADLRQTATLGRRTNALFREALRAERERFLPMTRDYDSEEQLEKRCLAIANAIIASYDFTSSQQGVDGPTAFEKKIAHGKRVS